MSGSPGLDDRVRRAVRGVSAPGHLQVQIRERAEGLRRKRRGAVWMIPVSVAAVAAGLLIPYQMGNFRWTEEARESYIGSVSYRVTAMMRGALGDHIHCAVFRKYPEGPPAGEALERDLGSQYKGLLAIVRGRVPEGYTLMMAHTCGYHGRQFVHLTWKGEGHLLSLLITRRDQGEKFEGAPPLEGSGIPIYDSGVQRFHIAAFESGEYLVYFISDLPERQNNAVMLAMAPDLKNFLEPRSW
jgi:hypothetical protein